LWPLIYDTKGCRQQPKKNHQRCKGECEDHARDGMAAFHFFFFRLAARRFIRR